MTTTNLKVNNSGYSTSLYYTMESTYKLLVQEFSKDVAQHYIQPYLMISQEQVRDNHLRVMKQLQVQHIEKRMWRHRFKHFVLEELAERFGIETIPYEYFVAYEYRGLVTREDRIFGQIKMNLTL